MSRVQRRSRSLAMPIGVSAALHLGLVVSVLVLRPPRERREPPPLFKVDLIAAPQGAVAAGTVEAAPPPTKPAPEPPPVKSKAAAPSPVPVPTKSAAPTKVASTPTIAKDAKPVAPNTTTARAGSASGGAGADVVGIKTEGIVFPFPGYLNNIVRQIYVNFSPRGASNLRAEVFFMIHRDGKVSNFRWVQRSGSQVFDIECQGAIEAAGKNFGPLPAGFSDDVLPVIFSFDPSKIR